MLPGISKNKEKQEDHGEYLLGRIKNILLINTSFTNDLGLMHGKLGVAIFFFYLSNYCDSKENNVYANSFLDEISILPNQLPVNFSIGLSGIGYGISFLNRNKFIKININSILENIDVRINKYAISCSPNDIETILSVGKYLIERLNNVRKENHNYYLFIELLIILTEKLEYYFIKILKEINNNFPILPPQGLNK